MKSDCMLQYDVLEELEWEPSIDSSQLRLSVEEGFVTLTGFVPRYADKISAERIAKSVAGVRGVANDIQVRLASSCRRSDAEIASAAISALHWHTSVPADQITVIVRNGWVTLEGAVEWQFQRRAARDAVAVLTGVKGVINDVTLIAKSHHNDVKAEIEAAIKRNAELSARRIDVEARNSTVKLKGEVATWAERTEAERVAWAAAGVTEVENDLVVGA
ncbi:MAG: BON domain-containing protein [Pirellulales bacterium]|nr:BON domain-containing protein [Pirellulales bacterium]